MPANLTVPRKWASKAILIKPETAYGVDTTPTGAVNWIEARNVNLTPSEVQKVDRGIVIDSLGGSGSIITGMWAKLSFDIAAVPSSVAGTAPKWSPLIMATGFSETTSAGVSVIYNLVSENIGSLCAYIYIGDTLHKLLGMRGELKAKFNANGLPMMSLSYDAVYVAPVDDAKPTVNKTGWIKEQAVNSKNTSPVTVNAIPLSYSEFEFATNNEIARLDLPGPQYEISIDDRKATASLKVLAPALSVFNPFTLCENATGIPISVTHGTVAGKKFKVDLKGVITSVDYDTINKATAYKLGFELNPVLGNDEITLTCL